MAREIPNPDLIPFTFKNGIRVQLDRVPPAVINKVRQKYPPPSPPLQPVDYGDGQRMEPNPSHPDHVKAMGDYYEMLSERIYETLIHIGVVYELTASDRARLEQRRAQLAKLDIEVDQDEKLAFILYVCIGSQPEADALRNAIYLRTHPQEEAIAEAVDSFPGEIRGAGHILDQGAEIGDDLREPAGVGISAAVE